MQVGSTSLLPPARACKASTPKDMLCNSCIADACSIHLTWDVINERMQFHASTCNESLRFQGCSVTGDATKDGKISHIYAQFLVMTAAIGAA